MKPKVDGHSADADQRWTAISNNIPLVIKGIGDSRFVCITVCIAVVGSALSLVAFVAFVSMALKWLVNGAAP